MKLRYVVGSVAVVAALGAAAALTVPALVDRLQAAPALPADAPPLDPDITAELVGALQRDLGLTEEQAYQRLRMEAWAAPTVAALRAELGEERYAGAWLTDDAGQLVVAVTDQDAAERVRAAGAEPEVVSRGVVYLNSVLTELNRRAEEAIDAALPGWHVDFSTNSVIIYAPPSAEPIAQRFAEEAGPLNDVIQIIITDEQPQLLNDLRGGDPYVIADAGLCSIGFPVVGGFVTAGHCAEAGVITTDTNGVPQGEFVAASFPGVGSGSRDWGVVAVNDTWIPQPLVNDYTGGTLSVVGSVEAPVGASVCRYGVTTGVSCGVILAKDATVIYPEGTVTGLTRTDACAEPGDSGGPWMTGDQAQGVTSGGSGDCTEGGTTYFQPLNEVLHLNNLTLVTTGGGNPPPPGDVETPPATSCDGYEYPFRGQIFGPDLAAIEPGGSYYRALSTGTHTVCLAGPRGTDFDLILQRWDGEAWQTVAWSDGPEAAELLTFDGTPGYYRMAVVSDSDAGGYAIGLDFLPAR